MLFRRSAPRFTAAAAEASSPRFQGDPASTDGPMQKVKKELWKALKINLVLTPIIAVGVFIWFPIESAEERKKLIEQYEKHSGWKT